MNGVVRTGLVTGVILLVAGAAVTATLGVGSGGSGSDSTTSDHLPATTPVTRATLTQTEQVNGTLGYGTAVAIAADGHGKITWLPPLGGTIRRGQPVYKADNLPVPLFYGGLPLYRPLHTGSVGPDVMEVEENLAALHYSGFTIDTHYTSATAAAVRKWQKANDFTQTGTFDPASVVITPAAVRVALRPAHLGDQAAGTVLTYTGTTRIVDVPLDVSLQALVKPGVTATITLPDSKTVKGAVATVGTVATAEEQGKPATIEVMVTIGDESVLGTLDQAPVIVTLVSATMPNVLTVPVAALTALPSGGYGVQVVTGSTSHYTTVILGMFGNGRVQISGEGIAEGTLVGIPS